MLLLEGDSIIHWIIVCANRTNAGAHLGFKIVPSNGSKAMPKKIIIIPSTGMKTLPKVIIKPSSCRAPIDDVRGIRQAVQEAGTRHQSHRSPMVL